MYKPKPGSWECGSCLVRNEGDATSCVACRAKKPGSEGKEDEPKASTQQESSDQKPASLASLFKPAAGSWECTMCLVRNKAEDTVCVACGTGDGGAGNTVSSAPVSSQFSFGIKKEGSSVSSTTLPSTGFTFGSLSTSSSSSTAPLFSFGVPSQQPAKSESTKTDVTPSFSFGVSRTQPNQPFTFTAVTVSTTTSSTSTTTPSAVEVSSTTPSKDSKSSFVFGSPGKYDFTFSGVKARSPRSRDISICESEDGVVEEDEGDHLYFEVSVWFYMPLFVFIHFHTWIES